MKQKAEVKYGGITANSSDYECHDGDLSASVNLIGEENTLKPLAQPQVKINVSTQIGITSKIVYLHETPLYRHYIVVETNSNNIYWVDDDEVTNLTSAFTSHLLKQNIIFNKISSIGNTLTIVTSDNIVYFKWKSNKNKYIDLGSKPPMVHIQFGLSEDKKGEYGMGGVETTNGTEPHSSYSAWQQSNVKLRDACIEFYNSSISGDKTWLAVRSVGATAFTQSVWSLINRVEKTVSEQGHFYAPFFVRYAYRLYDGSLWMHSAPVFMPVSTPRSFNVAFAHLATTPYSQVDQRYRYIYSFIFTNLNPTGSNEGFAPYVYGDDNIGINLSDEYCTFVCRPRNVALKYNVLNSSVLEQLHSDWDDIVKSIDIFVSLPLIRERSDKVIPSVTVANQPLFKNNNGNVVDINRISRLGQMDYSSLDGDWDAVWRQQTTADGSMEPASCNVYCDIPLYSEKEYLDKIRSVSSFYKVASFKPSDFSWNGSHEIDIPDNVLPNLAVQEAMTDDYHSHNTLLPVTKDNQCLTSVFNYNNRQNLACIAEQLYEGFPLAALVPWQYALEYNDNSLNCEHVYVYLRTEQSEKVVVCSTLNNGVFLNDPGKLSVYNCPLFYPDNRAFQMDIVVHESHTLKTYRLPMHEHPFLNGAITDGHLMTDTAVSFDELSYEMPTLSDRMQLLNYLYTSEVNNPFLFTPKNITQVGTGRILGLASATKALSQGQFGQFPLYTFTEDGVWALSVADDGSFSAVNPISRDVCTNPDCITSIDNAVLFPTDRGIMLLQGSDTYCITDTLLCDVPFNLAALPRLSTVSPFDLSSLSPRLSDFLSGCRMLYDYSHQHIIVFNPKVLSPIPGEPQMDEVIIPYPIAFVYSIKNKTWGAMQNTIDYTLNSYPDSLAVTRGNKLVSFSQTSSADETFSTQLLISRPLKLGMSDTLKTALNLIQRGVFLPDHVKTILYGSRDLLNWHLVASSTSGSIRNIAGSGYKYFRIVAIATLTIGESLSGATLELQPRHTTKLL